MKNKTLRLLGIAVVSVGLLTAQGPRMGRGGMGNQPAQPTASPDNRVERLALFLNLTETQKAAALKIFQTISQSAEQHQSEAAEFREKWQTAIENRDAGQIDSLSEEWAHLMAARRATGAKAQIEFRQILTAEQLEKLDALHGGGFGMMGNRGAGRGMGAMNWGGCLLQQP